MDAPIYKRILLKLSGEALAAGRALVSTTSACTKSRPNSPTCTG